MKPQYRAQTASVDRTNRREGPSPFVVGGGEGQSEDNGAVGKCL